MQLFSSSVSCIGIAALLILERIVKASDTMTNPNRRFFRLSIWVVILTMISEIATVYFENAEVPYRIPHILGNVLGFSLSPFISMLVGCAIGGLNRKSLFLFGAPAAFNLVLTILSIRFPLIFWVSAENTYMRGSLFWVYVLSYVTSLIYLLFQTLSVTRNYQNNDRFIPLALFFFVGLGTMGQLIAPWLHLSWLCVSFAIALYYMYLCDLLHQVDGLTSLLNRRTYEYAVHRQKDWNKTAVILFDIDDFKNVNDLYGHPFGDRCLVAISSCIRKAYYRIGLCYRIGGDEFCVLTKRTDQPAMEAAYDRFLHEIESMRKAEPRLPMVSMGYAFADSHSSDITDTILEADQNMYRFKRQRKESSDYRALE